MFNEKNSDIDPRECMYRLDVTTRRRITKALAKDDVDYESKKQIENALEKEEENKQLIDYDALSQIHKYLQRIDDTYNDFFYQLLDKCRVIIPPSRKDKELDSRLRKLKCKQANKEYSQMVGNINPEKTNAISEITSFTSEFRKMKPIFIAIFNTVLVIGGTFAFCYKAIEYTLPQPNIAAQVLFGIMGASVVALAEIYFLVKFI